MQDIRIQEDRLRRSTAHALARVFRKFNRAYGRALKPLGVSGEQAHVLALLWTEGAQPIGQLQRGLSLSGPTLTGAIRRMEEAELVRREPQEGDRRSYRIAPPPWDTRRKQRLFHTLLTLEDTMLAVLSAAERRTLHDLLARVDAALGDLDP
jgi:DNA-binding MarR family transcriptional regulator